VSRAVFLSIALSLTVGPNVSLLCKAWCDPVAAAASGCHHRQGLTDSPNLVETDSCGDTVPGGAAFLTEDVRRTLSAPGADQAVAAPGYQLAPTTTGVSLDRARRLPSLETRPLETALRI
jgi:hypothetical protein